MNSITLEPARFGITGMPCGATQHLRAGFSLSDMQPLDAPEMSPRGSVTCGHLKDDGAHYAGTTLTLWDRIRFEVPA
jgi:hypothetical protein